MRLPFRRTQKPATPRVYEPGADSPPVVAVTVQEDYHEPKDGAWLVTLVPPSKDAIRLICGQCFREPATVMVVIGTALSHTRENKVWCDGCGEKLVKQTRHWNTIGRKEAELRVSQRAAWLEATPWSDPK